MEIKEPIMLLGEEGFELDAKEDEKYGFIIKASQGKLKFEEIKDWINNHLKK